MDGAIFGLLFIIGSQQRFRFGALLESKIFSKHFRILRNLFKQEKIV